MATKPPNWILDPSGQRRVVGRKIRCPHCGSDKWEWLEAVPITREELSTHLLTKQRCRKCQNIFLFEDKRGTKYVDLVTSCGHCGSDKITETSKPDADMDLWHCLKCQGYMALRPSEEHGKSP